MKKHLVQNWGPLLFANFLSIHSVGRRMVKRWPIQSTAQSKGETNKIQSSERLKFQKLKKQKSCLRGD